MWDEIWERVFVITRDVGEVKKKIIGSTSCNLYFLYKYFSGCPI